MTPAPDHRPQPCTRIEGVVWPPVARGPAAALATAYTLLDATQWLPPAELATQQARQLAALVTYAGQHSPYFRQRLADAGLAAPELCSQAILRQLPELRRRDIQSAGESLCCGEVPESHRPLAKTQTSGSTGEPVTVRRTFVNQLLWLATTLREHAWHCGDFSGRFAAIRANIPNYVESPDWGPPTSRLFATGPSQGIPISWDVRRQVEYLQRFKPHILLLYPNVLRALCEHMAAHSLAFPGLSLIKTVGETLSAELRARAEALFAARVVDTYSSQELGIIAMQCPLSGLYHVSAETLIVEVVDAAGEPCEPGEIGRVVITDLHNFATPLVRYAIGDYAEVAAGPCPCGRGLPTLTRIVGRERNLVMMPDGTRHWPLTGFARFREIAPIEQYQFIQYSRTAIEVRLVVAPPLTTVQEQALTALIHAALGHPFEFRYKYFSDRIPPGPGGKFEEFVCRVGAAEA